MFENRGLISWTVITRRVSAVNIFVKDLGIVTSEAGKAGASTPLSEAALALFQEASHSGLGLEDDAAVAKILAARAGISLPGMKG